MRRVSLLFLMVISLRVAAVPLATVEGRVMMQDDVLPGCTVRLESATGTRTAVSDAQGRYRFVGVAEGEYEIYFVLDGATEPAQQRALVRGELVTVPVQELQLVALTEEITLACGSPCSDDPPTDRFALPRCSDYELHDALLESARVGDASSIALLQSRYAIADTYSERHRLGGELLGKVRDDAEIWSELVQHAEVALRFPRIDSADSPEFLQHCAELGVDPSSYWSMAQHALEVASRDRRSHALLIRALATDDDALVFVAILGLAEQHDLESLPLIENAIRRFDNFTDFFVDQLARFQSERADAVAMKFLEDEEDRERYRATRAEVASFPR